MYVSFFLSPLCVHVCVHVCVCSHIHVGRNTGTRVLRTKINGRYLLQSIFIFVFEKGFLTELGVHCFGLVDWLKSIRDFRVSASTVLEYQMHIPQFLSVYVSSCVKLWSLYFMESTVMTELSPQSHFNALSVYVNFIRMETRKKVSDSLELSYSWL